MYQLYIKDVLFDDYLSEESQVTINEYLDPESNILKRDYEQNITVCGQGSRIIRECFELLNKDRVCLLKEIDYYIYDTKCKEVLSSGVISSKSLKWCKGGCDTTLTLTELSEEDEIRKCLKEVLIWDDTVEYQVNGQTVNFTELEHPMIPYCLLPRTDADLLVRLLLVAFVIPILFLLLGVVCLILTAIKGIDDIFGDGELVPALENFYDEYCSDFLVTFQQLVLQLIGCGRRHQAPYVRDYLINACKACGVEFSSEIYNQESGTPYDENGFNPYYCAMLLYSPVRKGKEYSCIAPIPVPERWEPDNQYNINIFQLLNCLVPLHAESSYRLVGNTLYFNTREWYEENLPTSLNYDELQALICDEVCYSYLDKEAACKAFYTYAEDVGNITSNKALTSKINDIDRYSNDYDYCDYDDSLQTPEGRDEVEFCFSANIFRNDRSHIDGDPYLNKSWIGLVNANIGLALLSSQKYLILNQHQVSIPKLIIHDKDSPKHCALPLSKLIQYSSQGGIPHGIYEFNHPYFLEQNFAVNGQPCRTLFTNFIYKITEGFTKDCLSFTFTMILNCDSVKLFKAGDWIVIDQQTGVITERKLNYSERTITVTGII